MSLLDQVKANLSSAEEFLAEKVPGYSGYKQKEMRREADKLLRETIAARMRTVKTQLDALQQDLISAGKLDLLDETGSAATQIQTFIDRVRTASYGYSGLFSATRVKEEDLDRIYEFDATLLDYADRVEAAIAQASADLESENLRPSILAIRSIAREANATFDQRREFISDAQAV